MEEVLIGDTNKQQVQFSLTAYRQQISRIRLGVCPMSPCHKAIRAC